MCLLGSTHYLLSSTRPYTSISSQQHPPCTPVPWPSHLPYLTLVTGSMAFHLPRWVFTFKTRSFGVACTTGCEYPFTDPLTLVQNAITQQTHLATTRWTVGGMGTESPVIMPFGTSSLVPPSLLLWFPLRRCLTYSSSRACRCLPFHMEPWTARCAGCPGDLPSPIADSRGGCLHSGPRPAPSSFFYRTAIALWRGNATLWLHRQPTLPHQ